MRFRLFGFSIRVEPVFWFVALLLARPRSGSSHVIVDTIAFVVIVFVSILVHELGHAFLMRRFGREPSIALVGLGGETSWGTGPRVSPGRVAMVSLAGPLAGFLFAVPALLVLWLAPPAPKSFAAELLPRFLWVNVGWGVLNLLPIIPLDGGRVADVIAHSLFGQAGSRGVRFLSIGIAIAIAILSITHGMAFNAIIAYFIAARSFAELRLGRFDPSVPEHTRNERDEAEINRAFGLLLSGQVDQARALAERLLGEPGDEARRAALLELIAFTHLDAGDTPLATEVASRIPERFGPSPLLAARLMIASGRVAEGTLALEKAHRKHPSDLSAIVLAAALLDQDRPDDLVATLRTLSGMQVSGHAHAAIASMLFAKGAYHQAFDIAELGHFRTHDPALAYEAARSLAALGRHADAIDRLAIAIDAGIIGPAEVAADPDLHSLAGDPRLEAMLTRAPR